MVKQFLIKGLLLIVLVCCGDCTYAKRNIPAKPTAIKVQWADKLVGDYSFKNKWDYPEGVYRNTFGQLVCDGICPEGIEQMLDNAGRIYPDSLRTYYTLVDTIHQYHSFVSSTSAPEWAGTDYIEADTLLQAKPGALTTFRCHTLCNAATHSSLYLSIVGGWCYAEIKYNSIMPTGKGTSGPTIYVCTSGSFVLDKAYWARGIMKADFSLSFAPAPGSSHKIYWKGRIYCKMVAQ